MRLASAGGKSAAFLIKAVLLFGIFMVSQTEWCRGSDGVFPAADRTSYPIDVEPLGENGIQAGNSIPNQSVTIESNGDTIVIETHAKDMWPGAVYRIRTSGEVTEGRVFRTRVPAQAARGLVSILESALALGDELWSLSTTGSSPWARTDIRKPAGPPVEAPDGTSWLLAEAGSGRGPRRARGVTSAYRPRTATSR
jgi:hypothetical protein